MLGNIRALPRWGREGDGGEGQKNSSSTMDATTPCRAVVTWDSHPTRVGGRKKRTRHGGKESRETKDGVGGRAMHHLCLPLRSYARFTYTPFWWARTMRLTPQAYLGNKRARHDTKLARPPRPGICVPRHNVTAAMRSRPLSLMMMRHLRDKRDETRRGRLCLESLACDILPFGAGETSGHDRPLARPPIPSWRDRWPERGNLPPPTAGLLTPGPR